MKTKTAKALADRIRWNKLSQIDLILLPHTIASKQIKAAKSDKAKEILVKLVRCISFEYMKRCHIRGYRAKYAKGTKAYYEPPSLFATIKGLFK